MLPMVAETSPRARPVGSRTRDASARCPPTRRRALAMALTELVQPTPWSTAPTTWRAPRGVARPRGCTSWSRRRVGLPEGSGGLRAGLGPADRAAPSSPGSSTATLAQGRGGNVLRGRGRPPAGTDERPARRGPTGRGHVRGRRVSRCAPGPGVAALERAPLVLAHAAPHAGVLAGLERPRQAFVDHRATTAHGLRLFDLSERGSGVPNGKNSSGSSSRQAACGASPCLLTSPAPRSGHAHHGAGGCQGRFIGPHHPPVRF